MEPERLLKPVATVGPTHSPTKAEGVHGLPGVNGISLPPTSAPVQPVIIKCKKAAIKIRPSGTYFIEHDGKQYNTVGISTLHPYSNEGDMTFTLVDGKAVLDEASAPRQAVGGKENKLEQQQRSQATALGEQQQQQYEKDAKAILANRDNRLFAGPGAYKHGAKDGRRWGYSDVVGGMSYDEIYGFAQRCRTDSPSSVSYDASSREYTVIVRINRDSEKLVYILKPRNRGAYEIEIRHVGKGG